MLHTIALKSMVLSNSLKEDIGAKIFGGKTEFKRI
jgi:hypothetical protein